MSNIIQHADCNNLVSRRCCCCCYQWWLCQLGAEETDDASPTAEVHHHFVPQGDAVADDNPSVRLCAALIWQHLQVKPLHVHKKKIDQRCRMPLSRLQVIISETAWNTNINKNWCFYVSNQCAVTAEVFLVLPRVLRRDVVVLFAIITLAQVTGGDITYDPPQLCPPPLRWRFGVNEQRVAAGETKLNTKR